MLAILDGNEMISSLLKTGMLVYNHCDEIGLIIDNFRVIWITGEYVGRTYKFATPYVAFRIIEND